MRLLLFILAIPCIASPSLSQFRDSLIHWEGLKPTPYRDKGVLSVGIGHNTHFDSKPLKTHLTALEIEMLFRMDLSKALDAARKGVGDFDDLPNDIQLVVINLIWGVGRTGFMGFSNFRLCLTYRLYDSAATELADSRWYRQVGPARANWAYKTIKFQP